MLSFISLALIFTEAWSLTSTYKYRDTHQIASTVSWYVSYRTVCENIHVFLYLSLALNTLYDEWQQTETLSSALYYNKWKFSPVFKARNDISSFDFNFVSILFFRPFDVKVFCIPQPLVWWSSPSTVTVSRKSQTCWTFTDPW